MYAQLLDDNQLHMPSCWLHQLQTLLPTILLMLAAYQALAAPLLRPPVLAALLLLLLGRR